MTRGLPVEVHLPSGRRVTLRRASRATEAPATLLGAVAALAGGRYEVTSEGGGAIDQGALPLQDFHVLRAIATSLGDLPETELEVPCDNCGEALRVSPSRALELSPFLDGELTDAELDEAFDYDAPCPIRAVMVAGTEARSLRLREVTLAEALPLFAAIVREPLRITSAVVRGLGIAALGSETRPARIARALSRASDDAWADIVDAFVAAAYPPRLAASVVCSECGARTLVEAPALREFPAIHAPRDADETAGFPGEAEFERLVRSSADEIYRRLGVTGVDLVLEDGVAAVDDGGVPLLGSYEPGWTESPGFPDKPPEVRVYYRTFRAMWADDGVYDVEAEIAETIEHELEHHLAFLRGDDPEDEEERGQIAREARARVGETETLRQASRETRAALSDFLARTWPLWLLVLLGTAATLWSSR